MTALLEGDNIKRRTRARHGSIKDHAVVNKGKIEGHHRLYNDYLAENLVYIYIFFFSRRFWKCQSLFLWIVNVVEAYDLYVFQKRDCTLRCSLSLLQRATTTMRMLAYGCVADAVDYYVRIGESTSIKSLKRIVKPVADFLATNIWENRTRLF